MRGAAVIICILAAFLAVSPTGIFGPVTPETPRDAGVVRIDAGGPVITVLSPTNVTTVPYTLYGTAEDPQLAWVDVNGRVATLSGMNWSAALDLAIGNNSFRVDAGNTGGLVSNVTGVVRYWPLHDNLTANATYRFSVATPPGWYASQSTLAGAKLYLVLTEPLAGGAAASFSLAVLETYAKDTYAFVAALASGQVQLLEKVGITITEPVHQDTVDGHVAASFTMASSISGSPTTSVVTYVASEAWGLVYILTMNLPNARASANLETRTWILGGFQITPSSSPPPNTPTGTQDVWPIAVAAVIVAAAAIGIVWFLLRRRPRNPPRRPSAK